MTLDQQATVEEPDRSGTPPLRIQLPLGVAALLVAAVPFVVHAIVAVQGYFGHDDFLVVYLSANANPLDPGFLFQEYNAHLSPGMFLLAWAATAISPMSYPLLAVPLLIMQGYASYLFWRLLVDVFGPRSGLLVPFAVYAFSPIILFTTLWWAYGVTLIPLLLAMFGALRAHVRYLRTGRRKHAVYTVLWTLAGMAFYEKAILFIGLLFGITVLLAPEGEGIRWAFRKHWRVWVAHGVVLAGYAALFVASTGGPPRDSSADAQIPELARRMVLDSFLVPTSGFPVTSWIPGSADITPPSAAAQLLVTVAMVALVFAGVVVGRRRAGYAWALLAGYLIMDVLLVVVARLSRIGAIIGVDSRYIADAVPVLALCATFAFLAPREQATDEHPARPPLRAAVAGLTVLMMIGTTVSFIRLAPALAFPESRAYVANARAALAETPGLPLYDGPVPKELMIDWMGTDARASRVVSLLPGAPRFDEPGEQLYLLDGTGRPQVIERLTNVVSAPPGPLPNCGYGVGDQHTVIPLNAGVFGKRVARLEYYTADSGPGWLVVSGTTVALDFRSGVHVLYVPVDGLFTSIAIRRGTDVAPLCVGNVQVGEPVV